MRNVNTPEAKAAFRKLKQRIGTDRVFNKSDETDTELVRTALTTLFIRPSLTDGTPFEPSYDGVQRSTITEDAGANTFRVEHFRVCPHRTKYEVVFYATTPGNRFVYEFDGDIAGINYPRITIHTASVYECPSDGITVTLKNRKRTNRLYEQEGTGASESG